MPLLPLIRTVTDVRADASATHPAPHISDVYITPSRPMSGAAAPTAASAEDGINRNQLRQEAGRRVQHITCGVAERETYLEVLRHIGDRFAHTSHEPLRPLVPPPHLPSIARPREPQTAKFSRGLTANHRATRGGSGGGRGGGAALAAAAAAADDAPHVDADGEVAAAAETATVSSTSTGFTEAHRWEMLDVADRAFFQRSIEEPRTSADGGAAPYASPALRLALYDPTAPSPLDLLPTLGEKYAYLCELEAAERQYMLAYERWDQQVISEMMAVHFVTFVLKPSMDLLRKEELEQREGISQEEDRLSFFMYSESPLALLIQEGKRAMRARELQLDRILGLTPAAREFPVRPAALPPTPAAPPAAPPSVPPPAVAPDGHEASDTATPATVPPELAETPAVSEAASEGTPTVSAPPSSSSFSARTASPVTGASGGDTVTGVPSDEARRLLHRYVRQRHGASLNAVGTCATTPPEDNAWTQTMIATYPGSTGYDTVRRSSALVLPPVSSAQAPRRNAVGIADYVALLDESTKHRDQIVRAEERTRADMNRACYEELQVVLEWQRRRMHLERLLYWRHQREVAVQAEVEALTTIAPALRLDEKVLLLLEMLEGEEESARQDLQQEEHATFEPLWRAGEDSKGVGANVLLQARCLHSIDAEVWVVEAVARRQLVAAAESSIRACLERVYLEELTAVVVGGSARLRELWGVSVDPASCAAVETLQAAFRRSLRGRLGWRHTHQALGREIADSRNVAKIAAGAVALQSFKDTLAAEQAQLCAEQAEDHVRGQRALFSNESSDRTALCAQQEWDRRAVARARVVDVAEVYAPLFTACVDDEQDDRLEAEIEEELERDAMLAGRAALSDVMARKADAQQEERAQRRSAVREEKAAWRQLLSSEYDEREEHRIDEEERLAALRVARVAFTTAAEAECRRHREWAMSVYVARTSEALAELLSREGDDDSTRRGIVEAEAAAARELFDAAATAQCAAYAAALVRRRQSELSRVHQQAIGIEEMERRARLLHDEAAAWAATESQLLGLLSGPLRDLVVRRRAANTIGAWYAAICRGEAGRAASRRRRREDLARYREEKQLRAEHISQRLHTQQVRNQLDMLMQEMQKEQHEAVQQLLSILVEREEPRGREHVESLQEIVFGIIERNAESHVAELRRSFVNSEALIWQQESYERKLLRKTWQRTFAELLERERLQLSEDYFAVRIQRTWRGHASRMKSQHNMLTQRTQVAALEAQARAAVELEELDEAATQLYQPCLSSSYIDSYVRHSLARVFDGRAVAVMDATARHEWHERADLLWAMRYEDCDLCLCEEEARERRVLEVNFHKPFLLQAELKDEEHLQRTLLTRERTLFLLRILLREEHERRLSLVAAEGRRRASLHTRWAAALHANEEEL